MCDPPPPSVLPPPLPGTWLCVSSLRPTCCTLRRASAPSCTARRNRRNSQSDEPCRRSESHHGPCTSHHSDTPSDKPARLPRGPTNPAVFAMLKDAVAAAAAAAAAQMNSPVVSFASSGVLFWSRLHAVMHTAAKARKTQTDSLHCTRCGGMLSTRLVPASSFGGSIRSPCQKPLTNAGNDLAALLTGFPLCDPHVA